MHTADIHQVLKYLPHRYPFLLLDRILECTPGESVVALKNVTINEPFFQGHFPQRPVMPGVLILEALAQATGMLAFMTVGKPQKGAIYYLAGVDNARFKRPVEPGDQLIMEVSITRRLRGVWKYSGVAKVDGEVAASADLMTAMKEVDS